MADQRFSLVIAQRKHNKSLWYTSRICRHLKRDQIRRDSYCWVTKPRLRQISAYKQRSRSPSHHSWYSLLRSHCIHKIQQQIVLYSPPYSQLACRKSLQQCCSTLGQDPLHTPTVQRMRKMRDWACRTRVYREARHNCWHHLDRVQIWCSLTPGMGCVLLETALLFAERRAYKTRSGWSPRRYLGCRLMSDTMV